MAQRLQGVVGDVGLQQLFRRAAQDAGHVDGHVADADDGHALLRQIKLLIAVIGMAVIPGHKLRCRVAADQVVAGDAQRPVGLRAGRVEDLVVIILEIIDGFIAAQLHVAKEAETGIGGDAVEGGRHRLDLLVVGGHAVTHQAKRRGQTVIHIDLDDQFRLFKQALGGIETGRSGADDGNTQWLRSGSNGGHGINPLLRLSTWSPGYPFRRDRHRVGS